MKKRRRSANRILSLILAFAMLCTLQDMTAFAQTADAPCAVVSERYKKGQDIMMTLSDLRTRKTLFKAQPTGDIFLRMTTFRHGP